MAIAEQKILTISIPTYNRGVLVKGLFENLIAEIKQYGLQDKVEIQITNNCSTDNTEQVITSYLEENPYIFYTKNETNIGLGPNVLKCMDIANGKYCLLLGDDDRVNPGVLPKLISFLENHPDTGILVDTALNKKYKVERTTTLDLIPFLEKYYYFMGNAGVFVVLSSFIKENYPHRDFEGKSFSWPQTQSMIISAFKHPESKIRLDNFNILGESEHANITLYNSFYIWKVAYFELMTDIGYIRQWVSEDVVKAAKKYFENNAIQNFYNILQCGVFVDNDEMRIKTRTHIKNNMQPFSLKEKCLLWIVVVVLWIPNSIARFFSNLFILFTKGAKGLTKKNEFVKLEEKKLAILRNREKTIIREFSFEGAAK